MRWFNKIKLKNYEKLKESYRSKSYYIYEYNVYTKEGIVLEYESCKTSKTWREHYYDKIKDKSLKNKNAFIPFHNVDKVELANTHFLYTVYFTNEYKYNFEYEDKIKTKEDADKYNEPYYALCSKINKIRIEG